MAGRHGFVWVVHRAAQREQSQPAGAHSALNFFRSAARRGCEANAAYAVLLCALSRNDFHAPEAPAGLVLEGWQCQSSKCKHPPPLSITYLIPDSRPPALGFRLPTLLPTPAPTNPPRPGRRMRCLASCHPWQSMIDSPRDNRSKGGRFSAFCPWLRRHPHCAAARW